jgi:hypothetical protein
MDLTQSRKGAEIRNLEFQDFRFQIFHWPVSVTGDRGGSSNDAQLMNANQQTVPSYSSAFLAALRETCFFWGNLHKRCVLLVLRRPVQHPNQLLAMGKKRLWRRNYVVED